MKKVENKKVLGRIFATIQFYFVLFSLYILYNYLLGVKYTDVGSTIVDLTIFLLMPVSIIAYYVYLAVTKRSYKAHFFIVIFAVSLSIFLFEFLLLM